MATNKPALILLGDFTVINATLQPFGSATTCFYIWKNKRIQAEPQHHLGRTYDIGHALQGDSQGRAHDNQVINRQAGPTDCLAG
jgi:hypothetical protein